jgi:putative sigma-54 modulation protein
MNIQMSFQHLAPNDAAKTYATEKSQTLQRYFDGRVSVIWHFSIDAGEAVARCQLKGSHMDYHGEARAEALHAAIDLAIDKVERQIRKHKEIVKDHLHKAAHRENQNESEEVS